MAKQIGIFGTIVKWADNFGDFAKRLFTRKNKKPLTHKPKTKEDVKTFRSAVAKLKKMGLVSKSVDARKQKPTRYMVGQVRRFNRVLTGKEAAVALPSKEEARQFKQDFDVKGKRVIRTKASANEKFYYNRRTKEFTTKRKDHGQNDVLSVVPGSIEKLKAYDGLPGVGFVQPFNRFGHPGLQWRVFRTFDALFTTMTSLYESHGYKDWWKHARVEVIQAHRGMHDDDLDEGFEE